MFKTKDLRADVADYDPYISKEIMELHYYGHYFGYIKNLNSAIEKYPEFFKLEIPQLLVRLQEIPEEIREEVRNNGGGAINHEILWETISSSETSIHDGKLKNDVIQYFGSWEKFKELMMECGRKWFGSGWVWFTVGEGKSLKIYATANQDSPYMRGDYPIFGIDIWEHAYYLQHKNVKGDYLKTVWKILDWKAIEKRYLAINH